MKLIIHALGSPQSQAPENDSTTRDHHGQQPHPSHSNQWPRPSHHNQQPHPSHNTQWPHPSHHRQQPRPSHNNQQPRPSHNNQWPRPSSSSSNETNRFDIHIISGTNHHLSGIIIISGIVSSILFVLIIIIGIIIITIKYRKHTTKNWSELTEEEKITTMKKSGYVNPTYEFFDKVTQ